MVKATKTQKVLLLKSHGRYLGYKGMNFIIRDKLRNTVKEIEFTKVNTIILQTGNTVSTGALSAMMFWGMDVLILTASGRPVGTMIALDDNSHVKTRIAQYKAYDNRKGVEIAKQLVLAKIEAQSQILKKYKLDGFETHILLSKDQIKLLYAEKVDKIRNKLVSVEGEYSKHYFNQILPLFPKFLRVNKRQGYRAYDATNNLFNIAYMVLSWKIYRAIIKAKLEPYLGFLHRIAKNHPTLVSDLMEIYRCLVDDFLIRYTKTLKRKDFQKRYEKGHYEKKTPRIYLDHPNTNNLIKTLNKYFELTVNIPRIKRGKKQKLETLINEEASLLAMYIRGEKSEWTPRIINSLKKVKKYGKNQKTDHNNKNKQKIAE